MDTIKRETVFKAIKLLGYQPEDLLGLEILPGEVIATVWERDEHGKRVWTDADGNLRGRARKEVCNIG